MSGDTCIVSLPEKVETARLTSQITMGTFIAVGAGVSMLNGTSPVGIWSMINQFQMLMLLLLTGVFIPKAIKQYLSGMDIVLFNFDFIPFRKVPYISKLYLWMNYKQDNEDLKNIGVEYGSTTVNNISFLIILILFVLVHIPIVLIYACKRSKAG